MFDPLFGRFRSSISVPVAFCDGQTTMLRKVTLHHGIATNRRIHRVRSRATVIDQPTVSLIASPRRASANARFKAMAGSRFDSRAPTGAEITLPRLMPTNAGKNT